MTNKRQTIWLVSMLSLMVILSAYYLFTEETPKADDVSSSEQADAADSANDDGIVVTEVDSLGDDTGSIIATGDDKAGSTEISSEDEQVLDSMNSLAGNDLLTQVQMEWNETVGRKAEELRAVIANTGVSQEEASRAAEELYRLEDTDSRITSLQEKLLADFENAVVAEEATNFKVIVLTEKLDKRKAVEIVDLATKELSVTPDRVTVQYVS